VSYIRGFYRSFDVDWNDIHEGKLRTLKIKINFRSGAVEVLFIPNQNSPSFGKRSEEFERSVALNHFFK